MTCVIGFSAREREAAPDPMTYGPRLQHLPPKLRVPQSRSNLALAEGRRDNSLMSLVAAHRGTPHCSYDRFVRKSTLVLRHHSPLPGE